VAAIRRDGTWSTELGQSRSNQPMDRLAKSREWAATGTVRSGGAAAAAGHEGPAEGHIISCRGCTSGGVPHAVTSAAQRVETPIPTARSARACER
jgi:hypothetical protein